MSRFTKVYGLIFAFIVLPSICFAFGISEQFPTFDSHVVYSADPMTVVFDDAVNEGTVSDASFYVTLLGQATHVPGSFDVKTTYQANDTVEFTPTSGWEWGKRYQLVITSALTSASASPFTGGIPFDGLFVANIPNDLYIPEYDPSDPFEMITEDPVPLFGFNPLDPEADEPPHRIPGLNVTGAWKYTQGNPSVIIAIVDNGMRDYDDPEVRRVFFLNRGELPKPNQDGTACAEYDCNGDGRFDVDDYATDNRITGTAPYSVHELLAAFSDGVDDDGNGLTDDISGWDFLRNVNAALGVDDYPEGAHGDGMVELSAGQANNGIGDAPGVCPECLVLPIRTSSGLIYDYNMVAAGVRYAQSMGAKVVNFAGVNFTWSESGHQAFIDAYEAGALAVAASGDEMTFHHWMPASGEDVFSIKTIFPMVPVPLLDFIDLGRFGFCETYCTNYGTHTHVAVPARTGCTSDSTGTTSGMVGLIMSYAADQGIDLTAGEAKQILTMTADDVSSNCATIVHLLDVCQPGYDEHFGYGRPDLENALLALGDPDQSIAPTIPPDVRMTYPRWWETFDPNTTPTMEVTGQINSRVTPYNWTVEIAKGRQPLEGEFMLVDSGSASGPIDGVITSLNITDYISQDWARGTPDFNYEYDVTVRVRASYASKSKGTVLGEARKTISVHIDDDPDYGLVAGFPMYMGASGDSSPLMYDLDGDLDQHLEIVFGTGDAQVMALKYDSEEKEWAPMPGFPIDLSGDDPWIKDSIFASVAVGDLFGDTTPEIVVATLQGYLYVIDPALAATGDPILSGFPLRTDEPDNSSGYAFGHGRGFAASPVLADLDKDGMLEIIAAGIDQKVYAFKPRGNSGQGERLSGWPVMCRGEAGLVPANRVCNGGDIPKPIVGTPAVGILDPGSDDPEISDYPAVVVSANEACEGAVMATTRIYAIYHDGMDHAGGPFLPGWPAKPLSPLAEALPIPWLAGAPASPAVITDENGARISIGSTAWFPQLLHYSNGKIRYEEIPILVRLNAIGSSIFSSLNIDGVMQYVIPMLGVLRFDEQGLQLFNSQIFAMDLDKPHDTIFEGYIEDFPMLTTCVVGDLDDNGTRETIAGSGGYLLRAYSPDGSGPPNWPKYTQKWTMAAPAVGDMDGDGKIEVVSHTREGYLYAWESPGRACWYGELNSDWARFHHDERNTGFYGADTLPPMRIADLEAKQLPDGRIFVTFTAPGDDWGCGFVADYDIRYSTEASVDLSDPDNFAAATPLSNKRTPKEGGAPESFFIDETDAKVIAIQTVDDQGHMSRISNSATVVPAQDVDDDDDNDDDDTADSGSGDDDDDDGGCCG